MQYEQLDPATIPMLPERLQLVDSIVAQVKLFARSSNNDDVRSVAQILNDRLILRVPRGDGWQLFYYLPEDADPINIGTSIFVTPVKNIDLWQLRSDDVARRYETSDRHVAGYYGSTRTIYFPADAGYSIFWYGQILLHEGIHVLDHDVALSRGTPGRHWFTEWHAYRTQYVVLCAWFGQKFTDLLDAQGAELTIRRALDAGQHLREWEPDDPVVVSDLIAIFGEPSGTQELDYWQAVVSRCLVQHALRYRPTGRQRRLAVV